FIPLIPLIPFIPFIPSSFIFFASLFYFFIAFLLRNAHTKNNTNTEINKLMDKFNE
ncbi:hypothetical protein Q7M_1207, partial (plasmid) [Borrelia crocidurae str. Achema]